MPSPPSSLPASCSTSVLRFVASTQTRAALSATCRAFQRAAGAVLVEENRCSSSLSLQDYPRGFPSQARVRHFICNPHAQRTVDAWVLGNDVIGHYYEPRAELARLARAGGSCAKHIDCSWCTWFDGDQLPQLAAHVEDLSLANCDSIRSHTLQSLPSLTRLRRVSLAHTMVSDPCLVHLSALPLLTELVLEGCSRLSSGGLARLPRGLESLNVAHCASLNELCIPRIARAVPHLVHLDMSGLGTARSNGAVDTASVVAMGAFQRLQSLRLRGAALCVDATIEAMASATSLMFLDVSHTSISDALLERGSRSSNVRPWAGLRKINLQGCAGVTPSGVRRLLATFSSLELVVDDYTTQNSLGGSVFR